MNRLGRVVVPLVASGGLLIYLSTSAVATAGAQHHGAAHVMHVKDAKPGKRGGGGTQLASHGGPVEHAAKVYITYWGWTSDPSGEAAYQQNFFNGVGGSTWINSTTQYCDNVPSGTTDCTKVAGAVYTGNPSGLLKGTWSDNANPLPSRITQSALAAEAARSAAHFGNLTAASNADAQYIISTPTGHSTSGFGIQFCAWHSSTS